LSVEISVFFISFISLLQVRFITGNKILRILKSKALAPDLPEDMYFLIKKAVSIRKHLERNRKDKDAKFRLILVESRIHRLGRCVIIFLTPFSLSYFPVLRIRDILVRVRIQLRGFIPHTLLEIVVFFAIFA
jgi:ribosomal protein S15P/S13E